MLTCIDIVILHHILNVYEALSSCVAMGVLPASQRGTDVRCLCVDLVAQESGYQGFKFSRVGA